MSPRAYLLFYRRRSPEPLGGPVIREIVQNYKNPPESDNDSNHEATEGQRLGDSSMNGISREAQFSSSSDESEPETNHMGSLLDQGPSWSFGAMDVPGRRFDDENNEKANDGDDGLFEDDDSNVAVGDGSSNNGDHMEGLRSGVNSDLDMSFEDVPALQDDGSGDELPVMELRVDEDDTMADA